MSVAKALTLDFCFYWSLVASFRKGRTWAITIRRGSYKSLFLLNSGHFP